MTDDLPELILERDVRRRWPIGERELRDARRARKIGFYAIGRKHYYTEAQIQAYLNEHKLREASPCPSPDDPPSSPSIPIGSTRSTIGRATTGSGMTPAQEERVVLDLEERLLKRRAAK